MRQFQNNHLLNYFSYEELEKIYEIKDLYIKARIIVTKVFNDMTDKEGKPYMNHLLRVSNALEEEIEKVAGLLHDIVEDTEITYEDLIEIGFPMEIVEIVKLVTKEKVDKSKLTKEERLLIYYQKIENIINSGNIGAIRVKEADMSDNFDLNRLKNLSEEQQAWFHEKYNKPLKKLRKVLNKS